ncbi:MAG: hypothetical protein DI603_11560 [Roseateles depolymerans]|uniref:Uncharacterized protein n=1 Tax=Roseateles depolymerans TaxID=76731 RepID=A0A2W5DJK3_9BURK|nr:MAG: hypothetical protein DI603_11560 [Roseateles depolymerans]
MKRIMMLAVAVLGSGAALAKLPPLSDEAKAKAAETAAKTAHTNKVADFQLCKSMDRVAATYREQAKKAGKPVTPTETPACADPGPFVYTPPAPASAPVTTAAAAPAAPAKK